MTDPDRHLMTIFSAALDRGSEADRAAYLDGACGGDQALGARVGGLLRAHAGAGRFLEPPPADPAETGPLATARAGTSIPGPAAGDVVGYRYKLLERAGEGGMGEVWLAEQTEPVRRKVAVKLIKAGMDSKAVLARFEAERQALALMDHPNIAKVLDGGATPDGRPFFVMELVKGVPITKYCDDHRLPPADRLGLFVQVCAAVQHAHQKGVIHRDLKPSNVLVAPYDGRPVPKVIDFGIAKATGQPLTDRTLFTGLGAVVGTPEYMSPEQAELNNADVDTRSDIYSLGVLAYELLTGTTPLTRKRAKEAALLELLRVVREEEPDKPSTRLSTTDALPGIAAARGMEPRRLSGVVRGDLDWIVMKALEKDRTRRYETANGLAADLQRYLADEPVLACPPSATYRFRKFARRHRGTLTAVSLIAALLVLGTGVSTWQAVRATQAEGLAGQRLEAEKDERARAVAAERERKLQLVDAKLAQARAGRWSQRVGQRFDSVEALTEAAALARELRMGEAKYQELREEMVYCLALADARALHKWDGFPAGSSPGLGFDADLERYARSDLKGDIEVRQVEGDRLLARLPGQGPGGGNSGAEAIHFGPDGRLLAVRNSRQIPGQQTNFQVWDWRQTRVAFQPTFDVGQGRMAFSQDGRRLALAQPDGTVVVYATDGWTETARLKAGHALIALAFHPDGSRLAVAEWDGPARVLEIATGKQHYEVSARPPFALAWQPHGDLLAAACLDGTVRLWDGSTGEHRATLQGHLNDVTGVRFVAGGDLLLSTSWDAWIRIWDPWTGRPLVKFSGYAQAVSRDGRRVVGRTGPTLTIWDVNPGREYRTLLAPPGVNGNGIWGWDVSHDGRWLVAGGDEFRVWDLLTRRKEVASRPGSRVSWAKFHPQNGRELFTVGQEGLYRWSFEETADIVRIRPTARLLPPGAVGDGGLPLAGHRTVVARGNTGLLLDLKNPSGTGHPLEHKGANFPALSPDGRWAATGTHSGFGLRVWDADTGRLVKELAPGPQQSQAFFSPDSRWLMVSTPPGFELYEVGSWRLLRQIPRPQGGDTARGAAFSPDGKVAALLSGATARLFDTETWALLARLTGPNDETVRRLAFTSDGSRLLISSAGGGGVLRAWDLRLIREQLAAAGLDWARPPYPPAEPAGDVKPVRVEIDVTEYERLASVVTNLREGSDHLRAARWPQAIGAFSKAVAVEPENAEAHRLLGDALRQNGDPKGAMAAYRRAVDLAPPLSAVRNGLIESYNQAGQFTQAEALCRGELEAARKAHGDDSPQAAKVRALLGSNLLRQEKYADAEPVLRQCLAVREEKEPDALTTFHTKSMLGAALSGQRKYADAEALLLAAYEGLMRREAARTSEGVLYLTRALERLTQLYDAWEKKDRAAEWRKALEAHRGAAKTPATPPKP